MNARQQSSPWREALKWVRAAAKWVFVGLSVVMFFTHPALAAVVAAVLVAAWACGALTSRSEVSTETKGVRAPAYTVADASMRGNAETTSPSSHEVMRCWMVLF
ncbi:MAG: hypothetical protein ACYTAN_07675 [Planctomycetota bacterium]